MEQESALSIRLRQALFKDGRAISKRFTKSWLTEQQLYQNILDETQFLDASYSLRERIACILAGLAHTPLCTRCRSPTHLNQDKGGNGFRLYCSKRCAEESKIRSEKISRTKKKQDHEKANNKRQNSMFEKYGVSYNSQRPEVKKIISDRQRQQISDEQRKFLDDRVWLHEEYEIKKRTSVDIASELGVDYSTVLGRCEKYGFTIRSNSTYSLDELVFVNHLEKKNLQVVRNSRRIIPPLEIDVYLEQPAKVGIECNGVVWHSAGLDSEYNRTRHIRKTELCLAQSIKLLHFWSDEILTKRDICLSMVDAKLGLFEHRLGARETEREEISSIEARLFFEANHLQGFVGGRHIVLKTKGEIVQGVTIGRPRFDKSGLELLRFCTRKGTQVLGGLSKLLKDVPRPIVSYADRRYSTGNLYGSMGRLVDVGSPGYFWVEPKTERRITRYQTQKHRLAQFLGDKFDPTKTEKENMLSAGYRILYDCGHYKFMIEK